MTINIPQAPEWSDFPKTNSFLRSDDPANELLEFYAVWCKTNNASKWSHTRAPAGWRNRRW